MCDYQVRKRGQFCYVSNHRFLLQQGQGGVSAVDSEEVELAGNDVPCYHQLTYLCFFDFIFIELAECDARCQRSTVDAAIYCSFPMLADPSPMHSS